MDSHQNSKNVVIEQIKSFSYPKLHTEKEWYIGFNAFDPVIKSMRRKKIKLNHIKKIGERRLYADGLMKRLIIKLEKGWNPWIEIDKEKAYKTFAEAYEHYRLYTQKLLIDGVLREDTHRSYKSQLQNIEKWNEKRTIPISYIYQFNREFITEFLNYVYEDLKRTVITRNNLIFSTNFTEAIQ